MSPLTPTTVLFVLSLSLPQVAPTLLYGCTLSDDLCEETETCVNDGLFGQCWSPESGSPSPTVLGDLDETQLELLQLEVTRLANEGYEWPDKKAQCVFAYFKLSMAYDLQYDPAFCDVRSPANIWALIQLVDLGLQTPPEEESTDGIEEIIPSEEGETEDSQTENQLIESVQKREGADGQTDEGYVTDGEEIDDEDFIPVIPIGVEDLQDDISQFTEEDIANIIRELNEPPPQFEGEDILLEIPSSDLNDPIVQQYVEEIVEGRNPDLGKLSDDQLDALIGTVYTLKMVQEAKELEEQGEEEQAVPLDALSEQQNTVLKKDTEHVGETNTGLENTVHNIVKGKKAAISRVVGNRVYLKVNIKDEEQLYPLIEFLQNTIAVPNGLIFDDFQFDDGQLSLRIGRTVDGSVEPKAKNEKRIDTVEGVAQAVYKRRKDIARLSGAEVAETGIGIGEDSVPVESTDRDWLLMPVLFVCAFTITALLSVLAVHFYRAKKHYKNNITSSINTEFDGKMGQAYQDLCRQRMSQDGGEKNGSKHSSTSSWCEEGSTQPAIDISTGHVLLNFLQEYINDSKRMEAQWESLQGYRNDQKNTKIGEENMKMNRTVVPYDENLVPVKPWKDDENAYLNASFIYDDDPRQPVYIAAQSPIPDQISCWWQAVWEHDICLIVNVSTIEDVKNEKSYWPEQGSEVHGPFEVHLVSEHIWSDDYIVRSFYLKNLRNSQTRTITQFHYLSWKNGDVPPQPKTLLEFRRKVNRSYRGRSAPILIHSTNGAGRTGTYAAIDMLCARIQRGVKELDVVASVEHIRDQRPGLVATESQFKLIYACVAQEVSTMLKALPQ